VSIRLTVAPDRGQNRLWGIPFFGLFIRWILCIPQFIVLALLGFAIALVAWVSWIPILVNGRQADVVMSLFGALARLQSRTTLYLALAHGVYPWFGDAPEHPVQVSVDPDPGQSRLWGIPFVGLVVRAIVLIPHFIVIWLLGIGAALVIWVSWIPILINGRQADAIVSYLGGVYRYALRVSGYLLLMTGEYPPFRLAA